MFSNKIIVNLLNKEIEITGNDKVVIESKINGNNKNFDTFV